MSKKPKNNWAAYYQWQDGREPRPLFVEALAKFKLDPDDSNKGEGDRGFAIDMGCGDSTETVALLKN